MTRIASIVLVLLALALLSCESRQRDRSQARQPHAYEWPPALVDMADAMQAKLVHTQAIVEGLAIGDLQQVRANAEQLEAVSLEASWMVHDTVTYIAMSDDFRAIARKLAEHAALGDIEAATTDYAALTNSCVACHTYLRRERLSRDLPGRVSMLSELR